MPIIEADYRAVTPVFCAGANPNEPELRASSFKGVFRFWWRALAWARLGGDLRAIQKEEEHIFGGTGAGSSKVSIRIALGNPAKRDKDQVLNHPGTNLVAGDGARYLGYGLMEAFSSSKKNTKAGQLLRSCYLAPFEFTVRLSCHNDLQITDMYKALQAIGLFGGIGARTRRGYGSCVLKQLRVDGQPHWSQPADVPALQQVIKELLPHHTPNHFPEYTALHDRSRVIVVTANKSAPLEMLDLVGREMVRFCSWGKDGRVLGNVPHERNFQSDHDLMKLSPHQRTTHPQRIVFGLPHNYGKRNDDKVEPGSISDRRASPLFIHIHECEGKPVAVLAFLPAQFLPDRTDVDVGGARFKLAPDSVLWKPIHAFLDRFVNQAYKEAFTEAVEVRP